MPIVHAVIVALLVFVFPVWDFYEGKRARQSGDRIRWYVTALVWPWIVAVILFLTFPNVFTPPMQWRPPPEVFAGIVVGLVFALLLPLITRKRPEMGSIDFLLPQTHRERILFAIVALSAGVTEEVIYRGFLIRYLHNWLLLSVAIVAAAAIFGMDHAYQGVRGAALTFFIGLILTGLFILAGSLWLPIVIHAAIDLRLLAVRT